MTPTQERSGSGVQLRLWPGVAAAVLQWLLWLVVPLVLPDYWIFGLLGAVLCGLVILIWWAFFSRAPRLERWGGAVLIIAAMAAARLSILHPTVATLGMGMLFFFYAIP